MKTEISFEDWWVGQQMRLKGDVKRVAETAWEAALEYSQDDPNYRKRIGVEILERVQREAQFLQQKNPRSTVNFELMAIVNLIQELRK